MLKGFFSGLTSLHSSFRLRHLSGCLGGRGSVPRTHPTELCACAEPWLFSQTAFPDPSQLGYESVENQAGAGWGFRLTSLCLCRGESLGFVSQSLTPPPSRRAPVSSSLKQLFPFLHTAFVFLFLVWRCVWPHRPCWLFLLTAATSPYGSHYHKLLPSLKPVCKWVDCRQRGGQVHAATHRAARIGLDRYVGVDEYPLKPN